MRVPVRDPTLEHVVIATPSGAQIPIGEVAKISFSRGPSMIRDEEAQLTGYVYFNLATSDYGGFVTRANHLLRANLKLPAGYTYSWSGDYEFELRAKERLEVILPIVFLVIFLLLYMVFHSVAEAAILFFPVFFALIGGLLLQSLLGYNFSVAVAVGYIALFGIAVETAVVPSTRAFPVRPLTSVSWKLARALPTPTNTASSSAGRLPKDLR